MKPADDTEDTKTVQYCIVGHGAGESGNSVIRTASIIIYRSMDIAANFWNVYKLKI